MTAPARRLTLDTVVYGIGGSAARLVSVLFLPVFTRILGPEEYGALDLLTSSVALLTLVGMVGLNSSIFFNYRRVDDDEERRRLVATAIALALAFSAVVAVIGLAVAGPVAEFVLRDARYTVAVALTFVWLPLTVGASLAMDLLRLEFRPVAFSIVGLGRTIAANAAGVVLVVATDLGVAGLIAAQVAFSGAALAAGLWLARRTWQPAFDGAVALRMLRFGAPLVPVGLAYWVMSYSDRFFLLQFGGRDALHDVGIYAMANRLAQLLQLLVFAFQTAWWPFAYAQATDPTHRELFARIFRAVALGLSLVALALGLFAREVLIVVTTPAFVPAYPFVGVLALALAVNGLYQVVSIGVALAEQTWHMAWTSAAAAVINVALNLLLIPAIGIPGAAASTLFAYSVSAALLYRVAQRAYPIPYELRAPALVAAAVAIVLAGGLTLDASVPGATWSPAVSGAKLLVLLAVGFAAQRLLGTSPRDLVTRMVSLRHTRVA